MKTLLVTILLLALATVAQAQPVPGGSCSPSPCVDLTWQDNSMNEDGFRIERSENGAPFVALAAGSVGADIVAFKDLTVAIPAACGTSNIYAYRNVAFNIAGPSAYSNTASIKFDASPCPVVIPNAPSNLLAR